jgi:anti-sigma factor RsiW
MNEEQTAMWYDGRVEAFIDGELPDNEARMFAARLKVDRQLKQSVKDAISLQGTLRALPARKCPKSVSQQVFAQTGTGWQFGWNPGWNWAAAATAAVFAIALSLSLLSPQYSEPSQPSSAELAQARQDLAIAMAYLGRASSVAGREVSRQIINEGFVRPVSRGLQHSLPTPANRLTIDMEDAS